MKRTLKRIWAGILLIFAHSGRYAREAEEEGICNFGGQGRDNLGRQRE